MILTQKLLSFDTKMLFKRHPILINLTFINILILLKPKTKIHMKKLLLFKNQGLKSILLLGFLFLFSTLSWGQQVIGSFPYMNGGFEGQAAGALGTTLSSTVWTRQNEAGASSSIVTTSPRTGANYATVTNVTAVSRGLQSPQLSPFVAANSPTASTAYIVQYWVKNAATVSTWTVSPLW